MNASCNGPPAIPGELRAQRRWLCYAADKRPLCPATGAPASSTDPATWADCETAAAAVQRLGCGGIGFVLGDGFCGIDIDHCIRPDGTLHPRALAIVEAMQSYTEISPSGTGLHILWRGTKAGPACRKALAPGVGLEMYDAGRYFTVTGHSWHTPARPLAERTAAAAAVYHRYLEPPAPARQAPPPVPAADAEILEKARQAKGGEKLAALLAGNWQPWAPSHSEADLALCSLLAFWLGGDRARVDAAFRASGLYRKKWDQRRGARTYGERTLAKALQNPARYCPPRPPEPPAPPAPPAPGYTLDDTGNARRFRDRFGADVRYNHTRGQWFLWNGRVWKPDTTAAVRRLCDTLLEEMDHQAQTLPDQDRATQLRRFVHRSRGSRAKDNLLTEARHLPGIAVTDQDMDRDAALLNLNNGTLRLADGVLLPHDPTRLLTRLAGPDYDPQAQAPAWRQFLDSVTGGDAVLQRYLQVMTGYLLSGSTREQCLFFLYGAGANGKSTFLDVLTRLLGDYACHAQCDTLLIRRPSDAPRTDIARLKGARLVTLSECPADAWLDEALVKQLTGGDPVTARHLYGREFEFRPVCKFVMAVNHRPRVRGTDSGIWRRIRLVPFTRSIPEDQQDLLLPQKLRAELPGILNWALEGLRLWLQNSQGGARHGLPPCRAVDAATAAYRTDQDPLGAFLADCICPAQGVSVPARTLYRAYRAWCAENGEAMPLSTTRFGRELAGRWPRRKTRDAVLYDGLCLNDAGCRLAEAEPPPARPARRGPPLPAPRC